MLGEVDVESSGEERAMPEVFDRVNLAWVPLRGPGEGTGGFWGALVVLWGRAWVGRGSTPGGALAALTTRMLAAGVAPAGAVSEGSGPEDQSVSPDV